MEESKKKKIPQVSHNSISKNVLFVSDIHLRHNKIDTGVACQTLIDLISVHITSVDVVVFGGDIYDGSCLLGDHWVPYILETLITIMELCHIHNKPLIVLRGTISHDRNQLVMLPNIHRANKYTNWFKYVDEIEIIQIPDIGFSAVCIPDDLEYTDSDDAISHIRSLLKKHDLSQVDYGFVHNYFVHQYPNGLVPPKSCFREDQFDFVRICILSGHIHQRSMYGKVVCNGSFDRTCHGDEIPKGMTKAIFDGNCLQIEYIDNPNTTMFETWDLSNINNDDVVSEFISKINRLAASIDATYPTRYHYVRVIYPNKEIAKSFSTIAQSIHKYIRIDILKEKREREYIQNEFTLADDVDIEHITSQNLPRLINDFIGLSDLTIDKITNIVNSL